MTDESHDNPHHEPPDDIVDQAVRAIESETVPAGPPADLVATTLGALRQSRRPIAGSVPLVSWASVFKLAATAASLAMVLFLAAILIPIIQSPSAALADVFGDALAQVRRLKSMSYRQQISIEGKPRPIVTRESIAEDGRRRSETAGLVSIYDSQGNLRLTLVEPTHTALARQPGEEQGPDAEKSFLDWLKRLEQRGDKPDEDLGKKNIGDKPAVGFVSKQDGRTFLMWIEDATGTPLQIEFDTQFGGAPAHVVLSDFQFQQPLDEALFSLDVPSGYNLLGRPEPGKSEPPAGLQHIWSFAGDYSSIASAADRSLVYAAQAGGQASTVNSQGERVATFSIDPEARSLRAANLSADGPAQLLAFRPGAATIEARGADGKLLWLYPPKGQAADNWRASDVWPADLDGDGLDEVIVGGSGDPALQVLDHDGKLLWKGVGESQIWHVTAGDVEGDARPEVLLTDSTGKVQVFDAKGKHLRQIDPGFYAYTISYWRQKDLGDERLESLLAKRAKLFDDAREQKLQILLLKKSKIGSAESGAPSIEQLIDAEFSKDSQLAELTAQLADVKSKIKEQRSRAGQNRSDLSVVKRQLTELRQQFEDRKAQLQADFAAQSAGQQPVSLSTPSAGQSLALLTQELKLLQKNGDAVTRDVEKGLDEFKKLDTETADLENRETALQDLKSIIKRISYQLSLWNLELDADQRIKVADPAQRPQSDDAKQKVFAATGAGIIGFLAAMALAASVLRWGWVLSNVSGLLLGGASAALVWLLVPVHYEAQALVKVGRVQPVVIENVQNGGMDEGGGYDIYKRTQMQWVKSPFVLGRAARKADMVKLATMKEHKDDPVGFLESKIEVDFPGDAELMRISFKGTHREDLATIVNAVVDAYMEEIVTGDKMNRLKQRDLLNQHYSKSNVEYREKVAAYHELAKQLGANSSETAQMRKKMLTQRIEASISSRNALEQRIRDLEIQIELLKQRNAVGNEGGNGGVDRIVEDEISRDPEIVDSSKRLVALKLMIKEQEHLSADPNRSSTAALKRQAANLEEHIAERRVELQPQVTQKLADMVARGSTPGPSAAPARPAAGEARNLEAQFAADPELVDLARRISSLELATKQQQALSPSTAADRLGLRSLLARLAELEAKIDLRKSELLPAIVERLAGKGGETASPNQADVEALLPLLEAERNELESKVAAMKQEIEIQFEGGDRSKALMIVAGSGERAVPLAALDVAGKTRWSLHLSSPVANLAPRADRPWMALALGDGNLRVVDLSVGKEIAHAAAPGEARDVAWLAIEDGRSLLVVASDSGLDAYRLSADRQSAEKP